MIIRVKLEALIELPEGTTIPEEGRAFTLPNGDWVKPFIVLEKNDVDDLTFEQAQRLGCDVFEDNIEWEEV